MPNREPSGTGGASSSGTPVYSSRLINTTAPLYGGGDLSQDRTLYINTGELLADVPKLDGTNVFTGTNWFLGPINFGTDYPSNLAIKTVSNYFINGPNVFGTDVGISGVTSFGTVGGTKISTAGDIQVSGISVSYEPVYQGSISDSQRYVTSGEFSDFATRSSVNYFTATNVFTVSQTFSGGLNSRARIRADAADGQSLILYRNVAGSAAMALIQQDYANDVQDLLRVQTIGSGALFRARTGAALVDAFVVYNQGGGFFKGDVQISGTEIAYQPIYQGAAAAANRYVTSGEVSAGFAPAGNYAVRDATNWFTSPNTFTALVTHSGGVIFGSTVQVSGVELHYSPVFQGSQAGGSRYLTSGEVATGAAPAGNYAVRDAVNWFTSTNTFVGGVTFSGGVTSAGGGLAGNMKATTDAYVASFSRTDARNDSVGTEKSTLIAIANNPFDRSNRALQVIHAASGEQVAWEQVQRSYSDYPAVYGDTSVFQMFVRGGFLSKSDCQISGALLAYGGAYGGQQSGPNRLITSGELNAGAGSGDFVKSGSNYMTGALDVFSATTQVQFSGLVSYGSTGGTRFSPQGDLQVSGTTRHYGDILGSGLVGFGTFSPVTNFHISKDGSTPNSILYNAGGDAQVISNNNGVNARVLAASNTSTQGANLILFKTRGTLASPTLISGGDNIGAIFGQVYDGNTRVNAASISFDLDSRTAAQGDIPGLIKFNTTADGAVSPTERMRLDSAGNLAFGSSAVPFITSSLDVQVSGTTAMYKAYKADVWTGNAAPSTVMISGNNPRLAIGGGGSLLAASITTATVDGADNQAMELAAGGAANDSTRGGYLSLFGNEYAFSNLDGDAILGAGNVQGINANAGNVFIQTSGVNRLKVGLYGDVLPNGAGVQNFGDGTNYWNDVSYKTLTDRGCLAAFDGQVELVDGTKVSELDALMQIRTHKTKRAIYGPPMLDYSTFPRVAYKPAPIATEDTFEADTPNGTPKLKWKKGEPMGDDGVEMTSVFSMMLAAIRELAARVIKLEAK